MVVEELMTRDPVSLPATAVVRDALAILREGNIRHVPVVDAGGLVGMISDRDLSSFTYPTDGDVYEELTLFERLDAPVGEVMTSNVIFVDQQIPVGEVIDLMIEHKIGAVPVVDEHTEALVGIISYVDILVALRDFA